MENAYFQSIGLGNGLSFKGGRFSNPEQHLTLMLIEVASLTTGSDLGNALFKRVHADLSELGGTDKYAPGMRIGYTGDVAIDIEELAALVRDDRRPRQIVGKHPIDRSLHQRPALELQATLDHPAVLEYVDPVGRADAGEAV